ncbi:hypothetical protein [Sphingobium algorifonticola]|uniref:DUF4398 domain-containing protein n=1 Tax=Sphingobium algorifonticola TaxID=2008318 RepID=A0A437J9G7_9SPHN|nr:hypothetical protein [Sphingobium algorifonticola]RVT42147.1 hypothetical protein ENE74_07990 [Sphingobium algorifonticola]
MILRPLLSSLALLLSGCAAGVADTNPYPSLARRPVETRDYATPEPSPTLVPSPADVAADADAARFAQQADAGAMMFDKAYGEAERLTRTASGAAVSSEPWVAAQAAISGLEAARNDSVSALAALDTLYTARASAIADGTQSGDLTPLETARTRALAAVDSQNDRIDALKAMLAQP